MGADRLLIFSVSIGTGHNRAAESIKEAAIDKGIKQINIVDYFKLTSPRMGKIITKSYFLSLKKVPALYSKAYRWSEGDTPKQLRPVRKLFSRTAAEKVASFLTEYRPSGVICTHPFPLAILSDLKLKKFLSVPLGAVITDYTVHPLWVQPGVNIYFVGAPQTAYELEKKGVPRKRIAITGIPVAKRFSTPPSRIESRLKLGIHPDKTVILLMGGGLGFGPLDKVVKLLDGMNQELIILVVTGNNQELLGALEQMRTSLHQELRLYGYVENVEDYMSAADLLITKPGGLTIAEALCTKLPMVVVDPLPGHEEKNAFFLKQSGLAEALVKENNNFVNTIERVLNSGLLEKMKENIVPFARPNAAGLVVDWMMHLASGVRSNVKPVTID